jgi:hypothetical protein
MTPADATTRLICHPRTPAQTPAGVTVTTGPCGTGIRLVFTLVAEPGSVHIPAPGPGRRRDGLWRTTCFELFAMGGDRPAYHELNFSPSGDWAAYRFDGYRRGGCELVAPGPSVRRHAGPGRLALEVRLGAAHLPPGGRVDLGLAAVVESTGGRRSYWALRHPGAAPDFHHPEGFALTAAIGQAPGDRRKAPS